MKACDCFDFGSVSISCSGMYVIYPFSLSTLDFNLFVIAPMSRKDMCICGNVATQEALFEVDGAVTLIEKYCDICVKKIK